MNRCGSKENECEWVLDVQNSSLKYISPSVYYLLGYSTQEAMSKNISQFMTESSTRKMDFF